MSEEMRMVVEELEEMYGCDGCDHCPYYDRCDHEELLWGCPVWEDQMGDDL